MDFGSLLCSSRLYLFDQRDNQISNIVKYYYNLKELNKNFKKQHLFIYLFRNIIIICLLINLMHLYWMKALISFEKKNLTNLKLLNNIAYIYSQFYVSLIYFNEEVTWNM